MTKTQKWQKHLIEIDEIDGTKWLGERRKDSWIWLGQDSESRQSPIFFLVGEIGRFLDEEYDFWKKNTISRRRTRFLEEKYDFKKKSSISRRRVRKQRGKQKEASKIKIG